MCRRAVGADPLSMHGRLPHRHLTAAPPLQGQELAVFGACSSASGLWPQQQRHGRGGGRSGASASGCLPLATSLHRLIFSALSPPPSDRLLLPASAVRYRDGAARWARLACLSTARQLWSETAAARLQGARPQTARPAWRAQRPRRGAFVTQRISAHVQGEAAETGARCVVHAAAAAAAAAAATAYACRR